MNNSIADRVREIIADELGVGLELVQPDADLDAQLGADSLDAISLTLALEDAFQIQIPEADAVTLGTVGEIIRYVERHAEATT